MRRSIGCAASSHTVSLVGVDPFIFVSLKAIFFVRKSAFTEAISREIFGKRCSLGSRPPARSRPACRPPAPPDLLVRLRRGQAICRLAKLARLLIRNGTGRGERARISSRFAELTLRGCRLSPNRRSLLFGLACSVLCVDRTVRVVRTRVADFTGSYTQVFSRTALWAGIFRALKIKFSKT